MFWFLLFLALSIYAFGFKNVLRFSLLTVAMLFVLVFILGVMA